MSIYIDPIQFNESDYNEASKEEKQEFYTELNGYFDKAVGEVQECGWSPFDQENGIHKMPLDELYAWQAGCEQAIENLQEQLEILNEIIAEREEE